jgi:predicted ester cyclase
MTSAPPERPPPLEVVLAFLGCGERRDWETAHSLLDEEMTRIGPDGDVKHGRDEYLGYLKGVLGDADDYHYEVRRTMVSSDDRVVLVEIDEALTEAGGAAVAVSEAMVFDLTVERRIIRLSVYTKT